MKRIVLLFVLPVLFVSSAAAAAESVTLENFLQLVRDGNHAMQAGVRSVEAAYYGVLTSVAYQRTGTNISIGGSYVTGQEQASVRESDITAYDARISLTQRIDINGSYTLDERQQILYYEIRRANFDESVNTLMAAAEESYWSAVLARENIALQKDVLRQRRENHRVTEEKYKQQLVPRLDVIRSEAQVVAAESLVTQAESEYKNLLATLSALAGGAKIIPVEEPLMVPVFNLTANLEKAFAFRPDLRAARLDLERSRVVKKLKAKGLSPTLNAAISWVPFSDPWNSSSPQREEAAATLTLTIPVLDGNATKYEVFNADRLITAAEATLRSVENDTNRELTIARNNWENAEAMERDKKRQVGRSDEELRITELMYNEGMGAQIDLINAQTENQQVRTDYLNAVKGMYVALVQIRKAVGDYSPNENGSWREAVVKYGKGNRIANEMEKVKPRDLDAVLGSQSGRKTTPKKP